MPLHFVFLSQVSFPRGMELLEVSSAYCFFSSCPKTLCVLAGVWDTGRRGFDFAVLFLEPSREVHAWRAFDLAEMNNGPLRRNQPPRGCCGCPDDGLRLGEVYVGGRWTSDVRPVSNRKQKT